MPKINTTLSLTPYERESLVKYGGGNMSRGVYVLVMLVEKGIKIPLEKEFPRRPTAKPEKETLDESINRRAKIIVAKRVKKEDLRG